MKCSLPQEMRSASLTFVRLTLFSLAVSLLTSCGFRANPAIVTESPRLLTFPYSFPVIAPFQLTLTSDSNGGLSFFVQCVAISLHEYTVTVESSNVSVPSVVESIPFVAVQCTDIGANIGTGTLQYPLSLQSGESAGVSITVNDNSYKRGNQITQYVVMNESNQLAWR